MTKHLRAQSVVVLLLAVLLAACQSIPAVASLAPVAAGPLVTVKTRGGECVNGPCGGTTVIERDGRVHQTVPTAADLGQVPPDVLTALDETPLTGVDDLHRLLTEEMVGRRTPLHLLRRRSRVELVILPREEPTTRAPRQAYDEE